MVVVAGWRRRAKQHSNSPTLCCFSHVNARSAGGGAQNNFISTIHVSSTVCVLASKWNGAAHFKASACISSHVCALTCMHVSPNGLEDLEMRSFLHNEAFFLAHKVQDSMTSTSNSTGRTNTHAFHGAETHNLNTET